MIRWQEGGDRKPRGVLSAGEIQNVHFRAILTVSIKLDVCSPGTLLKLGCYLYDGFI